MAASPTRKSDIIISAPCWCVNTIDAFVPEDISAVIPVVPATALIASLIPRKSDTSVTATEIAASLSAVALPMLKVTVHVADIVPNLAVVLASAVTPVEAVRAFIAAAASSALPLAATVASAEPTKPLTVKV